MPRGLGDSPLSKERKKRTRRTSSQVLQVADTPVANSASPSTEADATAWTSASDSTSYNDVFFQRRDGDGVDSVPISSPPNGAAAEVYTASPLAEAQVEPVLAVPEISSQEPTVDIVAASVLIAAEPTIAPDAVSLLSNEQTADVVQTVEVEPEASPVVETPVESSPVTQIPAADKAESASQEPQIASAPQTEKAGFFSRLFGKRRK